MSVKGMILFGMFSAAIGLLAGCGKGPAKAPVTAEAPKVAASHNHDGWWCTEHGVPEGICAQCSPKLAAEFKAKGDWCKEHNRPESQCFICHPQKEAEFAAQYEAKYGKKPPKREAEKADSAESKPNEKS